MRLLKPVDYKLKVHLIINTSSKRENTINLGSESLGAISSWRPKSSIDRLSFLELRHPNTTPESAGMCQRKLKLLWNQAECFCKGRNVSSIPRWLQYLLSRQQVFSAPTKAVYVICSFGLCAGLIRQREFPTDGFVRSQNIILLFIRRLIKSLLTVHFSRECL